VLFYNFWYLEFFCSPRELRVTESRLYEYYRRDRCIQKIVYDRYDVMRACTACVRLSNNVSTVKTFRTKEIRRLYIYFDVVTKNVSSARPRPMIKNRHVYIYVSRTTPSALQYDVIAAEAADDTTIILFARA